MANHGAGAVAHDDHAHDHPGELTYVKVAIILAIITAVEVAIYYIPWVLESGVLVPALIVLSAVKFFIVVSYFMHLRFDDALLRRIFIFGLIFGGALILALMALFWWHGIDYTTEMIGAVVHSGE
jgi:cytochrome c oxidase subunit IV